MSELAKCETCGAVCKRVAVGAFEFESESDNSAYKTHYEYSEPEAEKMLLELWRWYGEQRRRFRRLKDEMVGVIEHDRRWRPESKVNAENTEIRNRYKWYWQFCHRAQQNIHDDIRKLRKVKV